MRIYFNLKIKFRIMDFLHDSRAIVFSVPKCQYVNAWYVTRQRTTIISLQHFCIFRWKKNANIFQLQNFWRLHQLSLHWHFRDQNCSTALINLRWTRRTIFKILHVQTKIGESTNCHLHVIFDMKTIFKHFVLLTEKLLLSLVSKWFRKKLIIGKLRRNRSCYASAWQFTYVIHGQFKISSEVPKRCVAYHLTRRIFCYMFYLRTWSQLVVLNK